MSENTEDQVNLEPLSDAELEAARAQGQDEAQFLEALEAKGLTAYLPTEEELAAIPPLPLLQDFITVPDGGLVFRTTTGRPLMGLFPTEEGAHLHLYSLTGPDIQIITSTEGCIVHLCRNGNSAASIGANTTGGGIAVNHVSGTRGATMSAGDAGGFVYVSDPAGEVVGGLEGTPQAEVLDPFLLQMLQPRPGEIMH